MTYNMCKCDFNVNEIQAFKLAIQQQVMLDLQNNPQLVIGDLGDDRFDPRALFKHMLSFVGT